MPDERRGLKKRFGLWLHRTLIKLRLVGRPSQNKWTQQSKPDLDWEDRWDILWAGFRTVVFLLPVTVLVGLVWVLLQPSTETIVWGTIFVVIVYVMATLWGLYRMMVTYREKLQSNFQ